jgi:hypothetical protein
MSLGVHTGSRQAEYTSVILHPVDGTLIEYLNTCVTIFGNNQKRKTLCDPKIKISKSLLISGINCFNLLKNKIFKIKIWSLVSENT